MTQRAHSRARQDRSLPEGYQYGDAGRAPVAYDPNRFMAAWPPSTEAGWNVIEGEHFDSDAERPPVAEGMTVTRSHRARTLDA